MLNIVKPSCLICFRLNQPVKTQNFGSATASKKLNLPLPKESVKSNAMDAGPQVLAWSGLEWLEWLALDFKVT